MVTGSFVSAARGGVNTNWAIARPPGQTEPLRPVIALHGKGSDAATVMAGGVEQGLAQAVDAGLPPFAVVAVDGGGSYWHKRASGEDSGAMVLDELIPMLDGQGLDTSRVGVPGLVDGRLRRTAAGARLGPARTAAISRGQSRRCGCRPAAAAPGAFDGADDFAANSVFGLPALASIPIRIDCGNSDPFYSATQAVHRPAAPSAGRRFLPGRARRRVLELAAARRADLDGAAPHRLTTLTVSRDVVALSVATIRTSLVAPADPLGAPLRQSSADAGDLCGRAVRRRARHDRSRRARRARCHRRARSM